MHVLLQNRLPDDRKGGDYMARVVDATDRNIIIFWETSYGWTICLNDHESLHGFSQEIRLRLDRGAVVHLKPDGWICPSERSLDFYTPERLFRKLYSVLTRAGIVCSDNGRIINDVNAVYVPDNWRVLMSPYLIYHVPKFDPRADDNSEGMTLSVLYEDWGDTLWDVEKMWGSTRKYIVNDPRHALLLRWYYAKLPSILKAEEEERVKLEAKRKSLAEWHQKLAKSGWPRSRRKKPRGRGE